MVHTPMLEISRPQGDFVDRPRSAAETKSRFARLDEVRTRYLEGEGEIIDHRMPYFLGVRRCSPRG